jgi:hypothetical protein
MHVIHQLKSHAKILEVMTEAHVTGVTPKSVWSFFLWDECSEPLRERVKTLANYAHSSFMAASGLIIYPIVYSILRLLTGYPTVLSRALVLLSAPLEIPANFLESIVLVGSIATGIIIVFEGRKRWAESDVIQFLLYSEKRERLKGIVERLSEKKA